MSCEVALKIEGRFAGAILAVGKRATLGQFELLDGEIEIASVYYYTYS